MKTFTRILLLIAGIAMIGLGVWLMFHPLVSLLTFSFTIAFVLLVSGIFHIVSYFSNRKAQHVSGWVLAEGILSTLLGVFLLFDQIEGAATLVLVFAMWVLFAGIMRTIGAFAAKQNNVQGWGWILTMGIIGIIVGFIALFNPVVSLVGIVFITGTFFIVEGIGAISTFFIMGKMDK